MYNDASHTVQSDGNTAPHCSGRALVEANKYRSQFESAFQYFQSRCQHHIHKLVNGKRVVPNACRSKSRPTECKHEAPWTNRVSPSWMTEPLLVCKGIAKRFKLRCSGARNWLGQTLGLRNDEWVNGTMPGLCIAFAGSNTDVKPNDRLPITDATHESVCPKRCLNLVKHPFTENDARDSKDARCHQWLFRRIHRETDNLPALWRQGNASINYSLYDPEWLGKGRQHSSVHPAAGLSQIWR